MMSDIVIIMMMIGIRLLGFSLFHIKGWYECFAKPFRNAIESVAFNVFEAYTLQI